MGFLISVIIPAYNAEKTISKCIDSVLNQTYSNLEVIVVNDGSIDNTKDVVQNIINKDKRVRLYNIKNQGVSHARNFGIDHAKGDYITFVDSDDYIEKEMYSNLLSLAKKYNVKISHCSYKNVTKNGEIISIVGNTGSIIEQEHDVALKCLIEGRLFIGGLCNKLYFYDLFSQYRLDESIKINEDILFNFQLFSQVNKSVYCDYPHYNYVSNPNSSTHLTSSIQKSEEAVYVSRIIMDLSKNQSYQESSQRRLVISLLGLYGSYLYDKSKEVKIKKEAVMDELTEYKKQGLFSNNKDLIKYYFYRYAPNFYIALYSIYDRHRVKKLDPEQSV